MKVLFACAPGVGHLLPLLPLARASHSGGHEVVVACGASQSSTIRSAGLQHAVMGPASIGSVAGTIPGREGLTGKQLALKFVQHAFCGPVAAGMAEGVCDLVTRWRPDIIVHEDLEFGSGIAAERAGIPHVTLQVTAWRPHMREVSLWLNELRARHGLAPDPGLNDGWAEPFLRPDRRRCAIRRPHSRSAPRSSGRSPMIAARTTKSPNHSRARMIALGSPSRSAPSMAANFRCCGPSSKAPRQPELR